MPKSASFSNSVVKGLIWSYLSAGLYTTLQLLSVVILSRLLSPYEFGLAGLGLIFINFAERFGHAGIGQALVQKESLEQDEINSGFTLSLAAGAILTFLMFILAPSLAAYFKEPGISSVIQVLSIVFLIDGLIVVPDSLLQRKLQFKQLALVENCSYFVGLGLIGIPLAWYGYGAWSLIFSQIILRLVKVVLLFTLIPHYCSLSYHPTSIATLLRTGFGFALGRIFGFLALYADNLIVGRYLGTAALGSYSRAYQLMSLPATLIGQISDRVLFPALSQKQSEKEVLRRAFFVFIEVLATISLPLSVAVWLVSNELVLVLLGNGWEEVASVLSVLACGIFFRTAYKAGDTVSRAAGKIYTHAWIHALYACAVLLGAYIGSGYGLLGVANGILFAVAINYIAMSLLAMRALEGEWKDFLSSHISGVYLALLLYLLLTLSLPTMRAFSPAVGVLAGTGIVSLLCLPITWLFLPSGNRARLKLLLEKVKKGKKSRKEVAQPVQAP